MSPQFWETFVLITVAGAAIGLAIRLLLPRVLAWRGVWFTWHTMFGPALVFDSSDADGTTVRLLNVRGTFQSVCYVDKELLWDPVCEYHRSWALVVHSAWRLNKRDLPSSMPCRQALVMGGGGYSFPKWLVAYRPDFSCDAVEIDPAITEIARQRLFLNELEVAFNAQSTGRLRLVEGDAWNVLQNDSAGFDLIVNDAFRGNRPLGSMQTDKGARLVHEHLREGGVYIGNVRTPLVGRKAAPLREARDAFSRVFAYTWIVPERPEEPQKPGNNALVCCDRSLDLYTIQGVIPANEGEELWQTS